MELNQFSPSLITEKINLKEKIFVIGCSRSGTSMTARILGNNPSIFTFNELHFFEEIWHPTEKQEILSEREAQNLLLKLFSIQGEGYYHYTADKKYVNNASEIINKCNEEKQILLPINLFTRFLTHVVYGNSKNISCEQTPRNAYFINDIRKYLPGSKFIYLIRDPRDVLKSQKNRWKRRKYTSGKKHPYLTTIRQKINYHPITISKLWSHVTSVYYSNKNEKDFITVKYENLITNPVVELEKICSFIGVEFNAKMMDVPKIGSSLKNDNPAEIGIDISRIDSWKKGGLSKGEIRICEQICKEGMALFNYETSKYKFQISEMLYYLIFPLQMFFILLFNLKKSKNLFETIRRRLFN